MVSRVFRAKWYYRIAGTVLPILSVLVWAFYSAMLYLNTLHAGTPLEPIDIMFYGLVTLFCTCFGLAGLLIHWMSKVKIITWDDRITYVRKRTRVIMKYSEITAVRYTNVMPGGIRLLSNKGSIRIFKDINGYEELYDILRQKIPAIAQAENRPLPERVWATNEALADIIAIGAMLLVAVVLGAVALLAQSGSLFILFILLAVINFAVAILRLYPWIRRPYAFFFTPSEIRGRKLFGEDEIPALFIKQIRLGTTYRTSRFVKVPIKAVFIESLDGTTFTLEETGMGYPAEQLYGMLRQAYGK